MGRGTRKFTQYFQFKQCGLLLVVMKFISNVQCLSRKLKFRLTEPGEERGEEKRTNVFSTAGD